MDEFANSALVFELHRIIAANAQGTLEAYDIHTRTVRSAMFGNFHLVLSHRRAVKGTHLNRDRFEAALEHDTDGISINIYIEPAGKEKHGGVPVL